VKILAIRLARFGDVVLLLPALTALKSNVPGSRLTFLTDHRLASLAEMCPAIDDIIAVDRIAMRDGSRLASLKSMWDVVREIRHRGFDLAIDFHGFRETNLLTWLSGSTKRLGLKRFDQSFLNFCFNLPPVLEDKSIHAAEVFIKVVERFGLSRSSTSPAMVVPETSHQWVKSTLSPRPYAAFYVDAPTRKRIWPPESFAAVADHLAAHCGLEIVLISGSEGHALLKRIQEVSRSTDHIRAFSNLTIPQLAAVVQAAEIWISNDTGPMHLGPILGVPTLALFSIGLPEHFKPTGPNDRYVLANPIERITVREVLENIEKLRSMERPDPRR
jgi:ADP-heptose:LPS heptosyltransferase